MERSDLALYLGRIGIDDAGRPGARSLRALHRAHLLRVPFENLSIHLGEPISLGAGDLIEKIVHRGRGGFCYELNGAFGLLLGALGHRVTHVGARVAGAEGFGLPLDHLALIVESEGSWLVDVGFGAHSTFPLRVELDVDQRDPGGTFRLVRAADGDIDVLRDGRTQYRLEMRPRSLSDFEGMCWWHQTSPRSHFTRSMTCSLLTSDGRVTLSGDRLIRTIGAGRSETEVPGEDLLGTYQRLFGLRLPRAPTIRPARQG